jgi:hypothetical protein
MLGHFIASGSQGGFFEKPPREASGPPEKLFIALRAVGLWSFEDSRAIFYNTVFIALFL